MKTTIDQIYADFKQQVQHYNNINKIYYGFYDYMNRMNYIRECVKLVLHATIGDNLKFPIPIREVAELLQLTIEESDCINTNFECSSELIQLNSNTDINKLGLSCSTVRKGLCGDVKNHVIGSIKVDRNADENSKRFLIAHEIGKFVLRYSFQISFIENNNPYSGLYHFNTCDDYLADKFAYNILMPYDMILEEKRDYESRSVNLPIDYSDWIIHLRDLCQVPEYQVVLAYDYIRQMKLINTKDWMINYVVCCK